LLEDEHFTNVTLVTEGNKQIKAHKVILSAFSPFFKEILVNNPHQHPLVYLRGVRHDHLQSMVDFIYLGQTKVEFEEVSEFIKAATDMQIKGLSSPQNIQLGETPIVEKSSEKANEMEVAREVGENNSSVKEEEEENNTLAIKQEVTEPTSDCMDQSTLDSLAGDSLNPAESLEVVMENPSPSFQNCVLDMYKPPVPKFPCEFPGCQYVAAQKRYLREHRQAIHEGIKYSCDMCEHRATTKSNLKKHKQLKHEVDKFFSCPQCEFAASTVGELTQHLGFCQQQIMHNQGYDV